MQAGYDHNCLFMDTIKERVGKALKSNAISIPVKNRIRVGILDDPHDGPTNRVEKLVTQLRSSFAIPDVGILDIRSGCGTDDYGHEPLRLNRSRTSSHGIP